MNSVRPASDIERALANLERAICQRRTANATQALLDLLMVIIKARSPSGILPPGGTPAQRSGIYTRVVTLISVLVSSPDFRPNASQADQLASLKPTLEAVFQLSVYGGAGHLIQILGTSNPDGSNTLRGEQVYWLCLFLSMDELPEGLLQAALQLPADQLLPLFAAWLSTPFVHTERGQRNRTALIANRARIENGRPGPATIGLINSAWMHCSYVDHPDRHAVKRSINEVWRRLAGSAGATPSPAPRRLVDRPTLVIAAERMLGGHAMQRSYGDCIRQLRSRYRTVCMAANGYISEDTLSMFDDVAILPAAPSTSEVAARMAQLAPDLIYYPSLGMSEWTQIAANCRFAPIQIMTLGHPAPAMCDTVDYSLVQAGHGEAAWEFGRQVLERRSWGRFVPFDSTLPFDIARPAGSGSHLHIAVNSGLMKLSRRFLNVCERIEAASSRPVHFHFFASAAGVMFDRLSQTLEQKFKSYTLESSRDYSSFLGVLSRCDLALAAFPFGNTNSTVDTCLLGIPTVAYYANEVLSIGDRDVMRMVGLPSWLVSDNDEDYFQTAMKLIHDDAARLAIVDQLRATDVKAQLFQSHHPENETEFVDAFWWIYQNHEALQASSQRLLKVGETIPA